MIRLNKTIKRPTHILTKLLLKTLTLCLDYFGRETQSNSTKIACLP